MNKIATSAGIAAVGMMGIAAGNAQTLYSLAPQLSPQQLSKTWSVSAAIRGFYDDNYNTAPSSAAQESVGFEISPTASLNLTFEQTYIGLSALYSMRYFDDRPKNSADHTFQFTGTLAHNFSERFRVDASDQFTIAQEPELLDPQALSSVIRTQGNNMVNRGSINLLTGLTPTISAVWGYVNTIYDFEQEGVGSRSALLDRMEHLFSVTGRWQATPSTVGLLGGQYGMTDYTSKDALINPLSALPTIIPLSSTRPETRNSRSYYGFVGVEHNFTAQLMAALRGGIQYIEFPNAAPGSGDDVSPYADVSVSWTYSPGSAIQGGIRYQRNTTDVAFNVLDPNPTLDAESFVGYASISHQFTANLTGSLLGQIQYSTFNSGGAADLNETFVLLGFNAAYRINQFLSAEAGYNFDVLNSEVPNRSFNRNRVYLGLRASY